MKELSDKVLIERLHHGDKASFQVLFERYYPSFIAFARKMLREDDLAEDLLQNVFLRLWISRERIDPERSLRNYLLVSVRNEVYAHFRSAFTARREQLLPRTEELADRTANVESHYAAHELEQLVKQLVGRMPNRRREIFTMSRSEHLTNAQIADRLGLSVRTVEKHIELALHEIRNNLPISALMLVLALW